MTWWRSSVLYQIYIRSFADANGDGIGDLEGIRSKLGYVASLGADAIWITPFYPSPMADHGYDVADYYDVDPAFGTLQQFDAMLADAHALGLRVVIDVVPNHTSSEHAWFKEAIADPSSPMRERYIFRAPKPDGSPPNDWQSVFGGPAWTLDPGSGQFYLHLFAPEQPDLNWRNQHVHQEFERVLRFWLDRGVDGFRIDVAHGLYKHADLPDAGDVEGDRHRRVWAESNSEPVWNQPEVHDVYRAWRKLANEYDGQRMLCGEVFLLDPDIVSNYVRPDELHQAFNFSLLAAPFEADAWKGIVDRSIRSHAKVGAACTWVLSNHDVVRHVTRYGGGERGRRRAAAALLTVLALPGAVYVYQGDELGAEQVDVSPEHRQDPVWFRSGGERVGRDGCRTPIPWNGTAPGFGFTSSEESWLPFSPDASERNVEALDADPDSIVWLYRRAIGLRRTTAALVAEDFAWSEAPEGCLAFRRNGLLVVTNMTQGDVRLPVDGKVMLASADGADNVGDDILLPAESSAWIELGARQ